VCCLVRWIHDYQDACVDKLENFISGGGESASSARLLSSNTRPDTMSKASSVTSPPPELHGPVFPPSLVDSSAATDSGKDSGASAGPKSRDSSATLAKPSAAARQPPPPTTTTTNENSVRSATNKPQCSATWLSHLEAQTPIAFDLLSVLFYNTLYDTSDVARNVNWEARFLSFHFPPPFRPFHTPSVLYPSLSFPSFPLSSIFRLSSLPLVVRPIVCS